MPVFSSVPTVNVSPTLNAVVNCFLNSLCVDFSYDCAGIVANDHNWPARDS
jgi:hypothetical protein